MTADLGPRTSARTGAALPRAPPVAATLSAPGWLRVPLHGSRRRPLWPRRARVSRRSWGGIRRRRLGLVTLLGARTARDVGLLALRAPATARDRGVIEPDQIAQIVQLGLRELARVADPQAVEGQVRERDALQLVDAEPERLDHAVELAVLAFVKRDGEPGVLALAGQHLDLGRHRRHA